MAEPLPKWLIERYSVLWVKFGSSEFDFSEASDVLDNGDTVSKVLSKLRRSGWLVAELNPQDSRKRVYRLNNPEDIIERIAEEGDENG